MAKTKVQKKAILESYKKMIQEYKAVMVLKPTQITSNEASEIKKELFDNNAEFHVVKNTLFAKALEEANLASIESLKFGEHAVIFTKEDIVSPSKVLKKYITDLKYGDKQNKIEVVGGFLDGELLSKEQVIELSEMPSKEGSIALILGVLDSALSGVVNVLEDAPRSVASILDQAFKE